MAQFNPNDYETVEERLKRAHAAHDDLRVVTINRTTPADRSVNMWVVEARIYLNREDQMRDLPKATGMAFEIDGVNGMANKTSALENCETSAIGRALANMNLSGNKRATREEMAKVERNVTPPPARNWKKEIAELKTKDQARQLYDEARTRGASAEILEGIKSMGMALV